MYFKSCEARNDQSNRRNVMTQRQQSFDIIQMW